MLNAQGAITNDLVMVECTGSQDSRAKEVFLLSELERVWEALSLVIRCNLIEGHNVRIANFGSFWFETKPVVSDGVERYHARRIYFGIDSKFALRYNIDTIKVPEEPPKLNYVKCRMAEIVSICNVPARTASMALREFFSYVGEGLFRQQVFKLTFPDVAVLVIRRDRIFLDIAESLRRDIFTIDSRKWPLAVREMAEPVVLVRPSSSSSSRPSTAQLSRQNVTIKSIEPRPAFVPSAPRDRLFSQIEKEPPRKLPPRLTHTRENSSYGVSEGGAAYIRESVFDALDPEECLVEEPEIEAVEEVPLLSSLHAYEEELPHPVRETTRRSSHEHSSVRDLLYGRAAPEPDPVTRGRKRYIKRDSDEVAALLKEL